MVIRIRIRIRSTAFRPSFSKSYQSVKISTVWKLQMLTPRFWLWIVFVCRFCPSFGLEPELLPPPPPPPLDVSLVFSPLSPFPLYFRTILITQNFPPIYIYRSVGRTGVGKALARIGRVAPVSPTPLLPAPRPRCFVCERHLSSRWVLCTCCLVLLSVFMVVFRGLM
jgi:hypothetical protein